MSPRSPDSTREKALRDLRASEERYRALAASLPQIIFESDPQGAITFLSDAYTRYTGLPPESGYDAGWANIFHPDDVAYSVERWQAAMQSGAPFVNEFRLRAADGTYRWHSARALPQCDDNGRILRWTGSVTDIDAARRAESERAFLAKVGRVLSESLDLETTVRNTARLIVPQLADWCRIDVRRADGGVQTEAILHIEGRKTRLARSLIGRIQGDRMANAEILAVVRSGKSAILNEMPDAEIYREMGFRTAAIVPLIAHGFVTGAITFVYTDTARGYAIGDLSLLEELGRRAGTPISNARTFEREHRAAATFQAAMLPPDLPQMPGLTFDAVYSAGSSDAQVGGDWYDAVRLLDGRIVISIGDVAGSGLSAAVTMGNMRQIIRGIAQVHADPALMLDAADRALRLEDTQCFVTAFVGVLDPIAKTLSYASAGHPPPLLRNPDGSVERLSDGGLPLGLRLGRDEATGRTIPIFDGSNLVLYTDGLTEFSRDAIAGERRLEQLIARASFRSRPHPAQFIKDAILEGADARDDVAILVVGINAAAAPVGEVGMPQQRWTFDVADAAAAQSARRAFGDVLVLRGALPEDVSAAEVVFGELIGNVVRYAPGPIEVTVDWSGAAPVLHVLDKGPGFRHIAILPKDIFSESGRGLFLVSYLTQDFQVSMCPNGGSHARAVLSLQRQRIAKPSVSRVGGSIRDVLR